MSKNICFTGHRRINKILLPPLLVQLQSLLEQSIFYGFTDFYTGGAIGWDTYCAQTILDLREDYPGIALHLVLPCSKEEQTARWSTKQQAAYNCIYEKADSCEFISEHYSKTCMRLRNKRLIELADLCFCYCNNPESGRSGTAQTIRMAQQKRIPVLNLADPELSEKDLKG